jgi:uncharacterized protein (TIGR02594 family)
MDLNNKLVLEALQHIHVKELPGRSLANTEILRYFETSGHAWVDSDETPWCSAFMCHVVNACGGQLPGTNRLRARSWLTLAPYEAENIEHTIELETGDVTILYRNGKNSVYGHVGLFIDMSTDAQWLYLLGGNQSNRVCIKAYPAYRFLGGKRMQG